MSEAAARHIGSNGSINIDIYRKPTHTDQCFLFDSHHPLAHKPGVIRTLHPPRALNVPPRNEEKEKEQKHLKEALKT